MPASNGYPTIRGAVMGPIVRALDAAGADCDGLLAEFGLSRRQLSDPYVILPLGRYVSAFERAAQVLNEPFLGLRLGQEIPVSELGPAGFLFMSSPTLGAAIARFSEALASWQSSAVADLDGNHGWPIWRYQITHPNIWPRRQDAEYSVSSMCHMIRMVRGTHWKPVEVHFEHATLHDLNPLMRLFQCPIRFQQPVNGVVLCAQDLKAPIRSVDVPLTRLMERHAIDLIKRDAMPQNLVDQVRDLVMRRLAREKLVVADIARDLGLSNRSLQRHLASANTSVRQIIREERQRSVAMLGEREGMSNATIARAVGYADATVLWRARRSWDRSE
ncbi:AraC family transcriptional regulator [Burkholderia gladioli]|uniref:AraC family transcriptional regulator n=1 Tax=Burkholderia gladioli TaxID=28095 RepID=UPI000319D2E3|nr:AraC family transcriptional regulator [Burkholderia gladioli]